MNRGDSGSGAHRLRRGDRLKVSHCLRAPVLLAVPALAACHLLVDTPNQSASRLLDCGKFRHQTVEQARRFGDDIIEPLRKLSGNFEKLEPAAADCVADVLAANPSPAVRALAEDLSQRPDVMARLLGLSVKARQAHALPREAEDDLIRVASGKLSEKEREQGWTTEDGQRSFTVNWVWALQRQALRALGEIKSERAVPSILGMLGKSDVPEVTESACEALGSGTRGRSRPCVPPWRAATFQRSGRHSSR